MKESDWIQHSGTMPLTNGAPSDGATISPGDLWSLAFGGEQLGFALIASVNPGFVLAWPATFHDGFSARPGILLQDTSFEGNVTVWPTRETGIGLHLLDQMIGHGIRKEAIAPLVDALDNGDDEDLVFAPAPEGKSGTDTDLAMITHWTNLCFHTLPSSSGLYISSAAFAPLSNRLQILREILNVELNELREYVDGVKAISDEQYARLQAQFGDETDGYLVSDPFENIVLNYISHPRNKHAIVTRSRELEVSETIIREAVRSDFALAARDDFHSRAHEKIRDAINRVSPS